jgi:C4-dicarboxylate-specific signal transduction histidine kinase
MRGVVIDVTERRRAQEDVERMRKELAHVTRVSTLGELAASMAHELNQPLAAILSNAQAARRFLAAPDVDLKEIRDILDDIIRDDKRAGEVIHRLRALVQKREAVDTERLNLNELVRDAERLLHGELVARNTQLVEELQPDLAEAVGGRVELQQVLLNLLVNALDAMRDVPVSERVITVETTSGDGWVELRVIDAGPGIPESLLPEIFRPFFTTKQHGLGMGLAISRSILEACGGTLVRGQSPRRRGVVHPAAARARAMSHVDAHDPYR